MSGRAPCSTVVPASLHPPSPFPESSPQSSQPCMAHKPPQPVASVLLGTWPLFSLVPRPVCVFQFGLSNNNDKHPCFTVELYT